MSRIRVLIGTRKGAFIATGDGKRDRRDVQTRALLLALYRGERMHLLPLRRYARSRPSARTFA